MREFIFKLCATCAYRELEKCKLWSRLTREHVLEGTFAYGFRDQHIRIDKNDQVRLKSWKTSWIGLLVRQNSHFLNKISPEAYTYKFDLKWIDRNILFCS